MNTDWLKTRQTKYGVYVTLYIVIVIAVLSTAKPNGLLSDRTGLVFQRFQLLGTLPAERSAL